MYNCDSIFMMGKTHKVCQDYAYADKDYLIISDGCSASLNSDIGARIITQCAKVTLKELEEKNYEQFGYTVITKARMISESLKLNKECLDATLIVVFKDSNDKIRVFMYGDGTIINLSDKLEQSEVLSVKFISGAPYYLSYWDDIQRKKAYKKEFDQELLLNHDAYYYNYDLDFTFDTDALMISSDGISSFYTLPENIRVSELDITEEISNFKTMKGEFLKRRVLKALQNYSIKNIYPVDDVAFACFVEK